MYYVNTIRELIKIHIKFIAHANATNSYEPVLVCWFSADVNSSAGYQTTLYSLLIWHALNDRITYVLKHCKKRVININPLYSR